MSKRVGVVGVAGLVAMLMAGAARGADTTVEWLDKVAPTEAVGVSFGVPFARGTVMKGQEFALKTAEGGVLPAQSWPLAYWPDGSLQWIGFATVAGPEVKGAVTVVAGASDEKGVKVTVKEEAEGATVDTGKVVARLPRSGRDLIESLSVEGRVVAGHGRLECIDQSGPDGVDHVLSPARVVYGSVVQKVTVEQRGPVRAVVKIEGVHAQEGPVAGQRRTWLPFVVRLYFYAGQRAVRMVHTVIFDGDQNTDFIKGLGITFDVPMREQSQNRHVRFGNSNGGVWGEPLQLVLPRGRGGGFGGGGGPNQLRGERISNIAAGRPPENAEWDSFRLRQLSSEGFTLEKQTNPKSAWVGVGEGRRAAGYVYIGDVSGGLGLGVKNFWQSTPASLEVERAISDAAQVTAWLWSPDADAMDMRHYDTHGHGNVNTGGSYEDYEADFATPVGVARTSELTLFHGAMCRRTRRRRRRRV